MNISINKSGETLQVNIEGNIESTTLKPFTDKITDIINYDKNVLIDLAQVEYIDSSGIRALLTIMRKLTETGKTLTIINASERIRRILQLSSLQDILKL